MSSLVTLADLKLRSRQAADMENSNFISDEELVSLVNKSATKLYDLLTDSYQDYYHEVSAITTDGVADTYPLPTDFYKLLGVDEILSASTGMRSSLKPYMLAERNKYQRPTGIRSLELQYVPVMPALVADSDTFDGINGWEEYIVLDAAIKMLLKEESDPSNLMAERKDMENKLIVKASNRDIGAPERVTDIHAMNPYETLQASTLRYRIQGANIRLVQAISLSGV